LNDLFINRGTQAPLDYRLHNETYGIASWFGLEPAAEEDLSKKKTKSAQSSVNPSNKIPFAAELDDLIRLHFLCLNRRVTTVLEFGVGKSTRVFAEAMRINENLHGDYVKKHLRRGDAFRVFSVDNAPKWVGHCKQELPEELRSLVNFTITDVEMTTFNGRICTAYGQLPNICPDLIYVDGPGQFGIKGEVRGISTAAKDRLPMSADVLLLEPFLLPGTLIVLDGRTANARFLKHNLQGKWVYHEFPGMDLNTFELKEAPLGRINRAQLAYCLGR
jgi:hypothetical protein